MLGSGPQRKTVHFGLSDLFIDGRPDVAGLAPGGVQRVSEDFGSIHRYGSGWFTPREAFDYGLWSIRRVHP